MKASLTLAKSTTALEYRPISKRSVLRFVYVALAVFGTNPSATLARQLAVVGLVDALDTDKSILHAEFRACRRLGVTIKSDA